MSPELDFGPGCRQADPNRAVERSKFRMAKAPRWGRQRSSEEVDGALREQIHLLRCAAVAYDGGDKIQAKPLSNAIHQLLHDGRPPTKGLLGQVNKRETLLYPSTASNQDDYGLRLCSIVFDDHDPRFTPRLAGAKSTRDLDFETWWNEAVFVPPGRPARNRREIILAMRDTDGGSHSDAMDRDEGYHILREMGAPAMKAVRTSLGTALVVDTRPLHWAVLREPPDPTKTVSRLHILDKVPPTGSDAPEVDMSKAKPISDGHRATVRQIAWELDQALSRAGY